MVSKKKQQKNHARARAAQRFGMIVTNAQMDDIVGQIQSGSATFVDKESNRVSLWRVKLEGDSFDVVYDKLRKTVVSFLPRVTREGSIKC